MTEVLTALMGAAPSSFKVVYKFKGERSADVTSVSVPAQERGWTQRHNPFLGTCAPAMFLLSLQEWHCNNFDLDDDGRDVYHKILYAVSAGARTGVVFAAAEDVTGSVASDYIKQLAGILGLPVREAEGVPAAAFSVSGFTFPRTRSAASTAINTVSVCLFQMPPNQFTETKPYKCCDGHRVISELAAYFKHLKKSSGGVAAATAMHPFLFQPLQCPQHASSHNAIWEVRYGSFYREMLDFKGKRVSDVTGPALRELARRSRGTSPFLQALKGRAAVKLFKQLTRKARVRCFSHRKSRKSVVSFYKAWIEDPHVDPRAWATALQNFFYSAVPLDASMRLMQDFTEEAAPCVCASLKLLFLTAAFCQQQRLMYDTLVDLCGFGTDPLVHIQGFLCQDVRSVEEMAWIRFDVALRDVTAASFRRDKDLNMHAAISMVADILLAIEEFKGIHMRVPEVLRNATSELLLEAGATCASMLLCAGANPCALIGGAIDVMHSQPAARAFIRCLGGTVLSGLSPGLCQKVLEVVALQI